MPRGAYAMLTEAGHARLQAAAPTHMRGVDEHFLSAIPPEDRAAFVRVFPTSSTAWPRRSSSDEAWSD